MAETPGVRARLRRSLTVDLDVTLEGGGRRPQVGRVVDLSPAGLFVTSPTLFPVGAVLRISLLLPERAGSRLVTTWGRVRWVNEQAARQTVQRPAGMGIEFIALASTACGVLQAFLDTGRAADDPPSASGPGRPRR